MENAILTKYLYFLKTVQLRLLLLGISRNLPMSKSQRSMRLSIQRKIRAKSYHPRLVPEIESWSLNWQFTSNFIPTSMLKESDPSITKTNSNGGGTFLRIIIFFIPKNWSYYNSNMWLMYINLVAALIGRGQSRSSSREDFVEITLQD